MTEPAIASARPYEPDESYMKQLFAAPPPAPPPTSTVCGHAFNGCTPEQADKLRWESVHGEGWAG